MSGEGVGDGRGRQRRWFLGGIGAGVLAGVGVFLLSSSLLAAEAPAVPVPPRYVEETVPSGLRHVYDGDFEHYVGGGVAVFDCDADRQPDLYVAGGSEPAGLFRNDSPVGGALRFTQVTAPETDLVHVVGAYPIDVDADGVVDLAVLRFGENVLLRGLGDCRFERANEAWSVDGGAEWTAAFSATWEAPSGLPTLAFGNYLEVVPDEQNARACVDSQLVRPAADGTGYGPPVALSPGLCTLSILFFDWNGTGRHDLRMANDRHYYREGEGEEQLWQVEPGRAPRLYTRADGWAELRIWGMGIAPRDVTGDGLPEVFLTSQGENKLQALAEGPDRPTYENIAIRRGVSAAEPAMGAGSLLSTAWHPEWADVNNDGLVDLYVAKGNVEAQPDFAAEDPSSLLLGQPDGTFVESAREAGIVSLGRSRGAALADLNLDGLLDVVEVNRVGAGDSTHPVPLGHWAALRLAQPGGNRDAIGSWLEVRTDGVTSRRQLTIGGGHAGGQLGWVHVGLGAAGSADVRVTWPDGEVGPWVRVAADSFVVLERGATEAVAWAPEG
ncbi:MAG: CRTAC1 family protein [Actinomycetia bacterium]|nr:CRTAC1 family protein [Actinomycetes bacterium]